MPLYEFRCHDGTVFESVFTMAEVPNQLGCPSCGEPARRRISPPRLSLAGTAAYTLIDATKSSAHAPPVVSSTGPSGRAQRYTQNPLHHKLPRP